MKRTGKFESKFSFDINKSKSRFVDVKNSNKTEHAGIYMVFNVLISHCNYV